ncbi:hypothetical protein E2C01_017866 [Portunus trituberculatus]|uniref:Uncharacterized protein n=1 Tax=Portunus trituberculatus TaxID=210409 RepID=A0A5B7DT32_PORTR|nr:hypothetical protein [Portunus trituberculatus]
MVRGGQVVVGNEKTCRVRHFPSAAAKHNRTSGSYAPVGIVRAINKPLTCVPALPVAPPSVRSLVTRRRSILRGIGLCTPLRTYGGHVNQGFAQWSTGSDLSRRKRPCDTSTLMTNNKTIGHVYQ